MVAVLSLVGLLMFALTILGPRGAQIVTQNRREAVRSGIQTRRDIVVGAIGAIPAAIIGVVVGYLISRK